MSKFGTTTCGPHSIALHWRDLTRANRRGLAEIEKLEILIEQGQLPSARTETFIHECLHFAQYFASAEQTEERVHATAVLLAQLLAPFMKPVK